ncbi:hypothetical protein [Rhizobium mayense]|uniref:Uncharacterized protein n=1 Tax=Rhizobium mayense TaxID=1312184 RepID=A0ABT7K1Z0_9HYPH|nr:hypothetical protein [Rhizobium mayense]MDL2402607.1 hypothetical protein [Rhizobium mayense]
MKKEPVSANMLIAALAMPMLKNAFRREDSITEINFCGGSFGTASTLPKSLSYPLHAAEVPLKFVNAVLMPGDWSWKRTKAERHSSGGNATAAPRLSLRPKGRPHHRRASTILRIL